MPLLLKVDRDFALAFSNPKHGWKYHVVGKMRENHIFFSKEGAPTPLSQQIKLHKAI
jgi:DNA-binding helix-hairpin-helix protein with protein kinase domain